MIMSPPFSWLYLVNNKMEQVLGEPVGKLFIDMIILEYDKLLYLESSVKKDLYFEGRNPTDIMWGFLAESPPKEIFNWQQMPLSMKMSDTLGRQIMDNAPEHILGEALSGENMGMIKRQESGHVYSVDSKTSGRFQKDLLNDAIMVFVRVPKTPAETFYFHENNTNKFLTYFMDPSEVVDVINGTSGAAAIEISPKANYLWNYDYKRLLKVWGQSFRQPFFVSINRRYK